MRRRSARVIKLVAGGEPFACPVCESRRHTYSFERFPMTATARCCGCGLETRCTLKPSKPPKPKPPSSPPAPPDYGWPPIWY